MFWCQHITRNKLNKNNKNDEISHTCVSDLKWPFDPLPQPMTLRLMSNGWLEGHLGFCGF